MVAIASIPEFIALPDGQARRLPHLTVPRVSVPSPGAVRAAIGAGLRPLASLVVGLAVLAAIVVLATSEPTLGEGAPFEYHTDRVGSYVVEPGDTLWSIARTLAPAGEVAGYAERIAAANDGGASLVAGAVLVLPAP